MWPKRVQREGPAGSGQAGGGGGERAETTGPRVARAAGAGGTEGVLCEQAGPRVPET